MKPYCVICDWSDLIDRYIVKVFSDGVCIRCFRFETYESVIAFTVGWEAEKHGIS